jgi:hypothetical protein
MIVPPLALGGVATYASYTIEWFLNGNFATPIFVGSPFPMSLMPPGNQQLQMVVTFGSCSDTSNVYSIIKKDCSLLLAASPLELQLRHQQGKTVVSWQIQSASSYRNWQIERSWDGRRFTAWQDGQGETYGKRIDDRWPGKRTFYRLVATTWTNHKVYSAIRWIVAQDPKPFVLYPNPVTQNQLTIQITNSRTNYRVRCWNSTGSLLHEQPLRAGVNRLNTSTWGRGQVQIQVIDAEGKSDAQPVLIGW